MNQLVDRFGRVHTYLRISVTDRCNLRCVYCMPAEGIVTKPKEELLTFEEIVKVASVFVELGINKIRITGGEPLVRHELHLLIERLARLPGLTSLAMTTNAVLLKDKIKLLKKAGLTHINISLDTLHKDRFKEITLRDDFDNVIAGLESALKAGFRGVKLNVVVMAGRNDDEVLDFVHRFKNEPINVRFIEYMPFKDNQWQPQSVVAYVHMKETIERDFELRPLQAGQGSVAKDFAVVGHPLSVSFISSMTDSFCSTCNRIRLMADGSVKSCLFYAPEVNLRQTLRNGDDVSAVRDLIFESLAQKPEAHPPMGELSGADNVAMVEIGG